MLHSLLVDFVSAGTEGKPDAAIARTAVIKGISLLLSPIACAISLCYNPATMVAQFKDKIPPPVRRILRWVKDPRGCFVDEKIRLAADGRVVTGPFKDMLLTGDLNYPQFMLGTYELEIYSAIEALMQQPFTQIIDVGAANGYYAVGIALRMPQAKNVAFETEKYRRETLLEVARLNGVDSRIDIRGMCQSAELKELLTDQPTLLIVDIEGGEVELLNPAVIPALKQTTMLVETHDFEGIESSATLRERFSSTHQIEVYPLRERTWNDLRRSLAPLPGFCRSTAVDRVDEKRQGLQQDWFVMTPNSSVS